MAGLDKITSVSAVREAVTIDLGDFHADYRGATFDVWVTPTRAHQDAFREIQAYLTEAGKEARETLKRMDQQHRAKITELRAAGRSADVVEIEEQYQIERALVDNRLAEQMEAEYNERLIRWLADTWLNWDVDDARQARDHLLATNPAAWDWLWNTTTNTIGEYRRRVLKNSGAG